MELTEMTEVEREIYAAREEERAAQESGEASQAQGASDQVKPRTIQQAEYELWVKYASLVN